MQNFEELSCMSMLHISKKDVSFKENPEHRYINHTSHWDRNNTQQNL